MKNETYIGVMFCNNEELVQPFYYFMGKSFRKSKEFPILTIDNGSVDHTWDEIKKHALDKNMIAQSENNLGIAKGRNFLVKLAQRMEVRGEFKNVVLIDSDLFIIRHNSILAMENMLESEKAGVVFGKQFAFDPVREGFTEKLDGFSFCCISREVFENYGLFDEQFDNYYDDTDFHQRMKHNKVKMVTCDKSVGVHMWGITTTLGSEGHRRGDLLKSDRQKYLDKWENQNGL